MQRILAAFWLLGLLNNFSYVVMLSGAEDMISGASGAVLLADILPTLLIKSTAPFWIHKFPYSIRIGVWVVFGSASFLITGVSHVPLLLFLGVGFASISSGGGEITMLALSSFYDISTVSYWSSGTGMAGIAGAGWYLLLHTALHVSPSTTLLLGCVFPLLYGLVYGMWLHKRTVSLVAGMSVVPNESDGVEMTSVDDDIVGDDDDDTRHLTTTMGIDSEAGDKSDGAIVKTSTASFRERFQIVKRILIPFMLPLSLVYFAEYTINVGVNPTLAFKDMSSRTFYVASAFVYQVGVFVSRSSGRLPITVLWPFPVLQFLLLFTFVMQSLYHFVPSAYIMLSLTFVEGLLGGATYVHAFRQLSRKIEVEWREFALGACSVADTCGIVVAAVASLFIECALAKHNHIENDTCVG